MITLKDLHKKELQQLLEFYRQDFDDLLAYQKELGESRHREHAEPEEDDPSLDCWKELEHAQEVLRLLKDAEGVDENMIQTQEQIVREIRAFLADLDQRLIHGDPVAFFLREYIEASTEHSIRLLEARMAEVKVELKQRKSK